MEEKKDITKVSQPLAQSLIEDLRQIINQTRAHVAATANYELTTMYWHIGERINREILENKRAEYGKQIVSTVSTQISWSHVIEILPLNGELQREFYLTLAASERWSVRRLRKEIDSMLFERTAMFFLNRKKMKFHFKNRNISFNLSNSPI